MGDRVVIRNRYESGSAIVLVNAFGLTLERSAPAVGGLGSRLHFGRLKGGGVEDC